VAYQVRLTGDAEDDLRDIYDYIAAQGSPIAARSFVNRILGYLSGFDTFPKRGTLRDDIRPGVHVIGFERRVSIAFVVEAEDVVILRILYAGRRLEV
jgi:toxin ParE1/3/4